jgi:hypothetical protein
MRGVRLCHNWTARSERRSGVTTGYRKGERKVARTEHGDRRGRLMPWALLAVEGYIALSAALVYIARRR